MIESIVNMGFGESKWMKLGIYKECLCFPFFFSFFFRKRNLGIYLVIEYNRVPQQTDTYSHYLVSCIAVVLSLSVKQNKEKYFQAVFW